MQKITTRLTNTQLTVYTRIVTARIRHQSDDLSTLDLAELADTLSARLDHAQRMVDEMAGELDAYDRMIEVA